VCISYLFLSTAFVSSVLCILSVLLPFPYHLGHALHVNCNNSVCILCTSIYSMLSSRLLITEHKNNKSCIRKMWKKLCRLCRVLYIPYIHRLIPTYRDQQTTANMKHHSICIRNSVRQRWQSLEHKRCRAVRGCTATAMVAISLVLGSHGMTLLQAKPLKA